MEGGSPASWRPARRRRATAGKSGPAYLKLLLQEAAVGAVIGKKGARAAELQQRSGCLLQVGKRKFPGTEERALLLGGHVEGVSGCLAELLETLHEKAGERHSVLLKVVVPNSAVSTIIGHGGRAAKELGAETECRVNVSPRAEPLRERLVCLQGTRQAVARAGARLVRLLVADPHLKEHLALDYTEQLPDGAWHTGTRASSSQPLPEGPEGTSPLALLPAAGSGAGARSSSELCLVPMVDEDMGPLQQARSAMSRAVEDLYGKQLEYLASLQMYASRVVSSRLILDKQWVTDFLAFEGLMYADSIILRL